MRDLTEMMTVHHAPYRYSLIDGMFTDAQCERARDEFPPPDDDRWHTFESDHEHRKQQIDGTNHIDDFPGCADLLNTLRRRAFIISLGEITGIDGLIPDLDGGGLHQTLPGGFLNMHTDSSSDFADRGWYRRVNVLLFLNETWVPSYGGALRLAGPDDFVEVAPRWNRLVIFPTDGSTWHGHPEPWVPTTPRRSLAVYYYTEQPPLGYDVPRDTHFRGPV